MVAEQEQSGFITVEHVKTLLTPGRYPYILALDGLTKSIVATQVANTSRERSTALRTTVFQLAACAAADVIKPPLPENVKETLWGLSRKLDQHELVQGNSGFYDFASNEYDIESMDATELLLEIIVDHGSDRTFVDKLQPQPDNPGEKVH